MSEVRRFENNRFVGTRDTMVVYDVEDDEQRSALDARIESEDLIDRKLVQAFGPDTLPEARNRGFRPLD